MHLIADAAATLGGRFNLIFHPHDRRLYQNAFGRFRERPLELTAGVKGPEGKVWSLPFTDQADGFPYVEQFDTLTSIRYRGVHPGLGIEFTMDIRAPFYPQDVAISTSPVYYVDLRVRRLAEFRHMECETPLTRGEIVFELSPADGVEFSRTEQGFAYRFTSSAPARHAAAPMAVEVPSWVECPNAEPLGQNGLRRSFDLGAERAATMSLLWSCWVEEPVLEVFEEPTALKYTNVFDSREDLVQWAAENRDRARQRCQFLDNAFQSWSLGAASSHMAALALHSYIVNTWWTERGDGSDWFSVWEGSCYYHSTIDVEYNGAMLYLALWPELLELLLDEWPEFEIDGVESLGPEGKGTGFLCHDMGADHVVGRQVYPHHMEVEENANYLLLLAVWAAHTGNLKQVKKKLPFCRRLAEFIVKSDTTGNGVPDKGVANTIDDASPALQYGREQVYLAVKSQAALWTLADLEQKCGTKKAQTERWRAHASKGVKTVEEEGWLEDHYAVSLSRTTEGLSDPWTGEALPEGDLRGWDDYSIYTSNGLLYLLLGGMKTPRWKMNRFADDIENAARATMEPYGCRHTSTSDPIVWFSQNMWRDYVAAYLGVDMLSNVERYWDYQVATGGGWGASLYYDTTEQNYLAFYPRGVTVFGMPMCAAGLGLNRLEGQVMLRPLRSTLRVPLLPLADWDTMRIPVLSVTNRQGVAVATISDRDLLEDLTVTAVGLELEPT
ncbi:MAG: glutaminase domain-containing protein [Planctomycetota bacterium]